MKKSTRQTTLRNAIRRRSESDVRMSGAWVLAPILSPIIIIFLMVFLLMIGGVLLPGGLVITLGLSIVIGILPTALMILKLIRRRNEHFKRSRDVRAGILNFIENHKRKREVESQLASLRSIHSELNSTEGSKSPGLFTILAIIIPFVNLYVMYFLTSDFIKHDKKERVFFRTFTQMADDLGLTIVYPEWKEVPDRSAGLYIVLTFFTGIFAIYWLWTLLKDPNQHFEAHEELEDHIKSSIL